MAQYEALRSFGGKVSAAKGRIVEITDEAVAKDLLKAGYVQAVDGKTSAADKAAEKKAAEEKVAAEAKAAEEKAPQDAAAAAEAAAADESATDPENGDDAAEDSETASDDTSVSDEAGESETADDQKTETPAEGDKPAATTPQKPKTHTVNRSARTGRLVSAQEAKANPDTTVTETVKEK